MTQALNVSTGNFIAGTSVPGAYSGARKASALEQKLLRVQPGGNLLANPMPALETPRSYLLDFLSGLFLKTDLTTGETLYYPAFGLMAEITRTGRAWSPNWSRRSGDPVGPLVEYTNDDELRWNEPPGIGGGPLIETTGASNGIANPRCEGALPGVLGGVGQLPTNWTYYSTSSVAATVVGRGVENGWPYLEVSYVGTAAGTEVILIMFQGSGTFGVSASDTVTQSMGSRIVSGDLTNATCEQYLISYLSGAIVEQLSTVFTPDEVHRRFSKTNTLGGSPVDSAASGIRLLVTAGAVNVTLRHYLPQFEDGATATSPVLPNVGTPAISTRAADVRSGGLDFQRSSWATHIDWDGTNVGVVNGLVEFMPDAPCHVPGKSLQHWDTTTNYSTNPRAEGADGTTLPTNWLQYGGVTASEMTRGTENGCPYLQARFVGTATGTRTDLICGALGDIAASPGDPFTFASGFKIVAGDMTNISSIQLGILWRASGGATIQNNFYACAVDKQHRRFFATETAAPASTVDVVPQLRLQPNSGPIDITIRIYAPQPEKKAYPTNPVLPEPGILAATTRAGDDAAFDIGGWYSATEYSMAFQYSLMQDAADLVFGGIAATFSDTAYASYAVSGPTVGMVVRSGGATVVTLNKTAPAVGDVSHVAMRVKANDFAASFTDETPMFDTSGAVPTTETRLRIGGGPWSASASSPLGNLYSFTFIPGGIDDAELEAFVKN